MKTLFFLILGQLFIFFGIILIIGGNYILPIISGAIGVIFIYICIVVEEKADESDCYILYESGEAWTYEQTRMEQKHDKVHTDLKGKKRSKARKECDNANKIS